MTMLRDISESDRVGRLTTYRSDFERIPVDVLRYNRRTLSVTAGSQGETWIVDRSSGPSFGTVMNLPPMYVHQTVALGPVGISADSYVLFLHDLLNYRPDQTAIIGDFPGEPYRVLKPIPVSLEWTGSEYLARFDEANIAMTGLTQSEALGNMAGDILDTYDH
jgi:hypothetical protein